MASTHRIFKKHSWNQDTRQHFETWLQVKLRDVATVEEYKGERFDLSMAYELVTIELYTGEIAIVEGDFFTIAAAVEIAHRDTNVFINFKPN